MMQPTSGFDDTAAHEPCSVCGSTEGRRHHPVLWAELIANWELSGDEAALVDRREGEHCVSCSCSMRTQALATAITRRVGWHGTLAAWTAAKPALRVLEINPAGTLTPWLAALPGHQLVSYPEVDMHQLPFPEGSWDLVIHSETIEHVHDPIAAMAECRRVLAPGGAVCFTIPMIPGRLSRRRDRLPPSYHGLESDPAYLVVTEHGADFWTEALDAGFSALTIVAASWPVSVAYIAER